MQSHWECLNLAVHANAKGFQRLNATILHTYRRSRYGFGLGKFVTYCLAKLWDCRILWSVALGVPAPTLHALGQPWQQRLLRAA